MSKLGDWFFGTIPENPTEERAQGTVGSAGYNSPFPGVIPPTRSSWSAVDVEAALEVSAIARAVQILTISVSQLDLVSYNKAGITDSSPLVKRPDPDQPLSAFVEETVWSLATYGNAYWRVYGDPGTATAVKVMHPTLVYPFIDERTGQTKYRIGNDTLGTAQVKHLKLNRVPQVLTGYGPLQKHGVEVAAMIRLREFADNWFDQSGVPTGVLSTDASLDADEAQAFAKAWVDFVKGNQMAVLSDGLKYEYLNIKPQEAQFAELQEKTTRDIARMFGIPALHLMAQLGGTSLTYLTLATTNLTFIQTTLIGYMTEIENAMSDLLPRGTTVKFDATNLLRADPVEQTNMRVAQVTAGIRTVNEIRAEDGFKPIQTPKPVATAPVEKDNTNGNS